MSQESKVHMRMYDLATVVAMVSASVIDLSATAVVSPAAVVPSSEWHLQQDQRFTELITTFVFMYSLRIPI